MRARVAEGHASGSTDLITEQATTSLLSDHVFVLS